MAFNKPQNHVRIDVYAPRHKNGTQRTWRIIMNEKPPVIVDLLPVA